MLILSHILVHTGCTNAEKLYHVTHTPPTAIHNALENTTNTVS
jgi:hypothetical protein